VTERVETQEAEADSITTDQVGSTAGNLWEYETTLDPTGTDEVTYSVDHEKQYTIWAFDDLGLNAGENDIATAELTWNDDTTPNYHYSRYRGSETSGDSKFNLWEVARLDQGPWHATYVFGSTDADTGYARIRSGSAATDEENSSGFKSPLASGYHGNIQNISKITFKPNVKTTTQLDVGDIHVFSAEVVLI
jgi:hypothetical protein